MYGMMLPSGNDAAYALAEYFGIKLYRCYINGNDYKMYIKEASVRNKLKTPM